VPTRPVTDWSLYPNFTKRGAVPAAPEDRLRCRVTGRCDMDADFMATLQKIRVTFGRPMVISSGFRDPSHPAERDKLEPGEHTLGRAVDVFVSAGDAIDLIVAAYAHGIRRIGVSQKGDPSKRFVHIGGGGPGLPTPALWSY